MYLFEASNPPIAAPAAGRAVQPGSIILRNLGPVQNHQHSAYGAGLYAGFQDGGGSRKWRADL